MDGNSERSDFSRLGLPPDVLRSGALTRKRDECGGGSSSGGILIEPSSSSMLVCLGAMEVRAVQWDAARGCVLAYFAATRCIGGLIRFGSNTGNGVEMRNAMRIELISMNIYAVRCAGA